ncbi:hypothetical protein, partial [Lactobacillus delbrueckii]|uniref:hypothetical protein n=1 Tax=Lactobacillus delbrueckii TaxID=1584 RepID=UPI00070F3A5B
QLIPLKVTYSNNYRLPVSAVNIVKKLTLSSLDIARTIFCFSQAKNTSMNIRQSFINESMQKADRQIRLF